MKSNQAMKCKDFETWGYPFDDYWKIEDEDRHQLLLRYMIRCKVIAPQTRKLSVELLEEIAKLDVIAAPFKIGQKSSHAGKKLHHLRQCFTAEYMYMKSSCERHKITKDLVTRSNEPDKENGRVERIEKLGGGDSMGFASIKSPVSSYTRPQKGQKTGKVDDGSKKRKSYSPLQQMVLPISPLVSRIFKKTKSVFSSNKGTSDTTEENDKSEQGLQYESPPNLEAKTSSSSGEVLNSSIDMQLSSDEIMITMQGSYVPGTFPVSRVRERVEDDIGEGSQFGRNETFNNQTNKLPSHPSNHSLFRERDPLHLPADHECDASIEFSPQETPHQPDHSDLSNPTSLPNGDESMSNSTVPTTSTSPSSEDESMSNPTAQASALSPTATTSTQDSNSFAVPNKRIEIEDHATKLFQSFFVDQSSRDPETVAMTMSHLHKLLVREKLIPDDDISMDTKSAIINNIQSFFNSSVLNSGGKRPMELQQALCTVWAAMMSPEYGYCNIPQFGGENRLPVAGRNKRTGSYKVVLPFGGILYCHESEFKKFKKVEKKLEHKSLYQMKQTKPGYELLRKCQDIRNDLYCNENPFSSLHWSRPKKYWNNFDIEIEDSVRAFCHDPDYVRPDNYSNQIYRCTDDHGRPCKHQRHNWMVNGNTKEQLKLYYESIHFRNLVATLKETHPEKSEKLSDDFVKKKVSDKKFDRFTSKCVKPETRASCVDPIETKCYDVARCLQLWFKGIKSQDKRKIQEKYLQCNEGQTFYDPTEDDCIKDERDCIDDESDCSDDESDCSDDKSDCSNDESDRTDNAGDDSDQKGTF